MLRIVNVPSFDIRAGTLRIISVFKSTGSKVKKHEVLFSYDYDGALFEERSMVSGSVKAVFLKEYDEVSGGVPIMIIEENEDE